jgi:hypothetical protein
MNVWIIIIFVLEPCNKMQICNYYNLIISANIKTTVC